MTVKTAPELTGLALMRAPFPANQISKLPKESRTQIDARKANKSLMVWNCQICGGSHHKDAVHLDYVGHAALTDRLLDADLRWSWEPVAFGPDGNPAFDRTGGLWIKLTVGGVTRLGYGSADGKTGGDAVKEMIGDALRNAAMRFGAALELWHKGDLHVDEPESAQSLLELVPNQTMIEADFTVEAIRPRKTAAQAKRDGDHDRLMKTFAGLDIEGVRNWFEAFDDLTADLPKSWLEPLRDRLEARREELMAHGSFATAEAELDEGFRNAVG